MKRYSLVVRGTRHEWSFPVTAPAERAADWRRDGLRVDGIVNTIPDWLPWWIPARLWCWLQDLWRLCG